MFDERSSRWISIYKTITVIIFWVFVIFGVIAGIGDCSAEYLDIGMGGDDDGFLDLFIWIIASGAVGYIQLVCNMLIIQLLNNVQIIREKLEESK